VQKHDEGLINEVVYGE